ncbi:MAG: hypothetical protein FOGNACKC_02347 [Anaerolineae bacterium]|nr:hypothetical protein [Anaerolineae bacterium]
MTISPIEALNISPEVADRLRERRPGYERIAALLVEFDAINRSKKGGELSAEDVADTFVQPALEALGWTIKWIDRPVLEHQSPFLPMLVTYNNLQIFVGVRPLTEPLVDERRQDIALIDMSKIFAQYTLMTNFDQNRIWRFNNEPTPAQVVMELDTRANRHSSEEPTLAQPVLEFNIRDYLTNESSEFDILAAEQFYNLAAADLRQSNASVPLDQQQNIAEQTKFPGEPLSASEEHAEPDIPPSSASGSFTLDDATLKAEGRVMSFIAPYGEPDGPRRRYETVMPGIAFQTEGLPRRTITALVLDRDSQKPYLLLAGGDIPAGTEIIQPALDSGDLIGEVERRLFDSAIGLGALASLEGERSFLSLLPSSRPIAGVTQPAENLAVCKFGGGSGYTTGRITALNSRVTLTDDSRRNILLPNAFTVSGDPPFSERGDVGAPVLAIDSNELVGVVVGYNDSGAICLPIQPILNALNVELVSEPVLFFREQTPSHDLSAANDRIFGRDRLGFSHYVSAFVSLINDKNTKPPLTIGIYGAWGTGKSFLMHKIACALKPQDCPGEIDESPPAALSLVGKTVLVEFEAWDYNGSDKLWAGLVERIFSALERELGWYWQLKFNFWRNLKRQWQQARQKVLPYVLISLALALVVVWLLLEPANRAAIATGGVITFLLLFVPQLIKLFSTSASQRVIDMFAAQDYKADIGFMGRIKADLRDFADNLPNATKVIVFIDDLDRCDPKKAVEVLEAVKLLLELDRFIVFLAIDARIITQAVEEYYGKVLTEAEITGYEYLDKIVQIPFSIPEPRPAELRNYLGSLMGLSEAQVQALEPEIVPPAPEFVARRVTSPPPTVSAPASGDGPSGEATVSPPATASPPANEAKQPSPRPTPPAEPTESEARPVTPTPRPFDTIEVPFTPDEQKAFLRLYPHLDPNPRRLKRLVNIYRLVRVLLRSQSNGQVTDFVTTPAGQSHVLAWLVLCEQWPYASHMMLEEIDQQFKAAQTDADARLALEQKTIGSIYPVAQQRIAAENNEALQKLDLKYERLEAFFNQHLAGFSLADLRRLRPFTINFNPALSAEVRLTLAHH